MKSKKSLPIILFILSGIITELLFLTFLLFNDDGNIPLYMFTYFEAFILFFFAYFLIKRFDLKFTDGKWIKKISHLLKLNEFEKLKLPLIIILFGIIFRLTLFPAAPTNSDDVYRYVWEGKVVVNGYNPFQLSPEADELKQLRDENYEDVTFKNIPAVYPPFSQLSFAAAYLISGNDLFGLKLLYLICEIITMLFLLKLLAIKKHNLNLILIYAWLPLVVMEFFVSIHLDPLGIMFLVIFIFYFEKEKYLISAVPFALSFLSKLYPLILFPLLIKKAGLKKSIFFGIIFFIISAVFYLPFIEGDLSVITALKSYLTRWEFNGSVYNLLKIIFADKELVRIICSALLVSSIIIISFRYKDFTKSVFGVLLTFIIFSATVYPWYLGWLAAVNPFIEFYSVMSLFFTINLSSFTPLSSEWREYYFVLIIEYIPFFILLGMDVWERRNKRN